MINRRTFVAGTGPCFWLRGRVATRIHALSNRYMIRFVRYLDVKTLQASRKEHVNTAITQLLDVDVGKSSILAIRFSDADLTICYAIDKRRDDPGRRIKQLNIAPAVIGD